ncbi:SDR family NAD(P)-dependent oxidoreductase [Acidisphaera sp. L21]|uniref:SDR family NAD(P)-dependent oxidoreductase n=1 Tax=Acidisphaera sp. L21 TaxID=1641851 RepID=UPI00131CB5AB|nr:SDR family oxidoreductase [Acidisphaera sp. L21]
MDVRFDSRVVLVSGTQGIGIALATAFKDAGANVHLVDIDPAVTQAAAAIGVTPHVADLADRAASTALVKSIAAKEGRLDILALSAGGVCGQADVPLADVDEASWDRVFGANVKSALWLSQAAAPIMEANGWGRIVIISSGAGLRASLTGLHAYASAKHAVVGLTKQLSVGLAKHGITVNSVAPGLVLSNPSTMKQWEGYGADGQERLVQGLHSKRLPGAMDIATAALFFASEQAGAITGQILSVDGGRS